MTGTAPSGKERLSGVALDGHDRAVLSGHDSRCWEGPCTAPKCRDWPDLRVSVTRLRGSVVLVDHAAEYLPALDQCVKWHHGRLVMKGWLYRSNIESRGLNSGYAAW